MSIFKIRLRKSDMMWTQYIRIKYNYTCQKCGRVYIPDNKESLQNLGVSHYHSRDHENTRFDEDNCTAFCNLPCHRYWGGDGHKEYEEFMIQRLGQRGFDLLALKAHIYKKRDDYSDKLVIKALLKEQANNILVEA